MKETKVFSAILILLLSFIYAFGIETKDFWDDSVRIAIIWNDGTGSDGMPDNWQQDYGEIGDSTRAFVQMALQTLNPAHVYEVSSKKSEWPALSKDVNKFREHFPNNQLPTAIIYINAGYLWGQHSNSSHDPYNLLKSAADLGIGIVAIGDDAAADGQHIFPELKGPDTTGKPIILQGYGENGVLVKGGLSAPYMQDAIYWVQDWNNGGYKADRGYEDLKIWLNRDENKKLPDQGLLWKVDIDTLHFLEWEKEGRGQADADMWEIKDGDVQVAARIGFQTAVANEKKIPKDSDNNPGAFKAIAALQRSINRVVMLGYQPQYLADTTSSLQIIYNSVFWASNAKEQLKIPDIIAEPGKGNPNTVGKIKLELDEENGGILPPDDAYDIWFTTNGQDINLDDPSSNSTKYQDPFSIAPATKDVRVKAVAVSKDTTLWQHSNQLDSLYEYVGGPVITSARLIPGQMKGDGFSFEADTLEVTFSEKIKRFDHSEPFTFKAEDDEIYTFRLDSLSTDDKTVTFEIVGVTVKNSDYWPKERRDSITINPDRDIEDVNGVVQDGSNNFYVAIDVEELPLPQIDTPVADPGNNEFIQKIDLVSFTVSNPDKKFYTIRYEINGDVDENSTPYEDPFKLDETYTEDVIITARAFSDSTHLWESSEICTVTYKYSPPPVLDSAIYSPGGIEDPTTSKMAPDTLVTYFDQGVEKVSGTTPFIFWDENGNEYTINLENIEGNSSVQKFVVKGFAGKDDDYLPQHLRDLITIDPDERITSKDSGIYQDGSNNDTIPLIVKELPSNVKVTTLWFDRDDENFSDLSSKLNNIPFDEGTLILVDPFVRLSESELEKYKGSMVVLDMLGHRVMSLGDIFNSSGNVIAQKIELNGRTQFAVIWDGTNTKGRRVGSAAYLAVIEIVDNTGKNVVERAMIPVKKSKK